MRREWLRDKSFGEWTFFLANRACSGLVIDLDIPSPGANTFHSSYLPYKLKIEGCANIFFASVSEQCYTVLRIWIRIRFLVRIRIRLITLI
jgi:hypothetical protein